MSLDGCDRCRGRQCDWPEIRDHLESTKGQSPDQVRASSPRRVATLGGVIEIASTIWDKCPVWYRDKAPERHVAQIVMRWARRWAPGTSELTTAGDDAISVVRAIDRFVEEKLRKDNG